MGKITVIIHTYNSAKDISAAIESAKLLTDSVLVVDMESEDDTVSVAQKNGARTVSFPRHLYVEPAREFGIKNADSQWALILDTDERLTKELAGEIRDKIKNNQYSFYKIPRKNIFGKRKWLKHGGWWPDHQIRLIKKDTFIRWPKEIHSTPLIKGEYDYLASPLTHFFHGDLEKMVEKTAVFENIESNLLFKAKKSVSTPIFFRKFMGELIRRMFAKMGFLDGPVGIIESIYQAFSKTITYLYLYEKKNRSL